jgi:hypothetical protein
MLRDSGNHVIGGGLSHLNNSTIDNNKYNKERGTAGTG